MTSRHRRLKIAQLLAFAACLVVSFQNCGAPMSFEKASDFFKSANSGNGGSYGGKPGTYINFDSTLTCDAGADGLPLPNNQIKVLSLTQAEVVRSNCQDIAPIVLNAGDFQFSANGVIYQGREYLLRAPQTEFQIVAARCPASYQPIAGAARVNLLTSSQSLVAPDWLVLPGVTSIIEGTLAGLDGFRITRNNTQGWQRVRQNTALRAGRLYSLSVLARHGSGNVAQVDYEDGAIGIQGALDTVTGSVSINATAGFSNISTASYAISNAHFFTIYFSIDTDSIAAAAGVTTANPIVGDSIFATAVQLEEVSNYCAP